MHVRGSVQVADAEDLAPLASTRWCADRKAFDPLPFRPSINRSTETSAGFISNDPQLFHAYMPCGDTRHELGGLDP